MADAIYVNGQDGYSGNILLDPDGTVTRAEMYDAIAEVGHQVELQVPDEAVSCLRVSSIALVFMAIAVCIKALFDIWD